MKPKITTYEERQIQRMATELLTKDKWALSFIKNLKENEISKKRV